MNGETRIDEQLNEGSSTITKLYFSNFVLWDIIDSLIAFSQDRNIQFLLKQLIVKI